VQDFREVGKRLSNWGRWGKEDERGTVNLITPECVVAASQLIKRGAIFDLGIPFDGSGPQPGGGRINPVRLMSETGAQQNFPGAFHYADDYVFMPLQSASQWDGLAHVYYDDQLYNGFPASDVGPYGALHCSIDKMAKGIVGRGVLLDIPRLRGVDWLEPGDAITSDELDATGVTVEEGDIVLVHTGRDRRRDRRGAWNTYVEGLAGLDAECARWLYEKDPAVLGADGVSDVMPGSDPEWPIPIHMCALVGMGIHLLDNLRLDLLADACAERGRWEFLFVVAPLQIGGGTGSPVNPVAIL
jgi:kynurenine formamidase